MNLDATTRVIVFDGKPVSSCCRASITVRKEYTDVHVYTVDNPVEYDNDGNITSVTYRFVKTYDGMDGENFQANCDKCGREVTADIDWDEG